MKKIYTILMVLMLLIVPLGAASQAASWGNPDVTSPYVVSILPVKETTTLFGNKTYNLYSGSAAAGDTIWFAVRVDIPENVHAATITLKQQNVILNSTLNATLPMTSGSYYLTSTGSWTSSVSVISGYCTDIPTITASITGTERISSAGGYRIIRSDGYIFDNGGRGVQFYPDSQGKVYSTYVFSVDYRTKLTNYILNEDSEAGAVARNVLKVLGMDGEALLTGNVFMNERTLASNFGILVDTSCTKTWGTVITPVAPVTVLPTSPILDVPQTGMAGDLFVCGGILAMVAIACHTSSKGKKNG